MGKTMRRVVFYLYLAAALCWLGQGVFWLIAEGDRPAQPLDMDKAILNDVEMLEEGHFAVLGGDGQLVFENVAVAGGRLWLDGYFQNPPLDVDLYYRKQGQEHFSLEQRVFGRPLEAGGYEYRLPPGQYSGLRLDTGTEPGNLLVIRQLVLHPPQPPQQYFAMSLRGLAAFLLAPALASCCIYTIIEWTLLINKKRAKRAAGSDHNE